MASNPNREIELFAEAIRLSAGERTAFLDRACAGDTGLRRRIEVLIKSNDRVGAFLEEPPTGAIRQERAKVTVGEKPGDRVGRYKLLQQIGEGGCGIVFMAEQEEPVRRRVALKVIKPGMDTKSVIARFEAERQALALMDHCSIAKIFDAGATESGRPYFVMELVHGIKITEYCDRNSLTTLDRLKLFAQVCHALQHAHQKGILHRDIKPSNILVTETDHDEPLPVIIDFGIAKATTDQELTDKTFFTAVEMLIGTPAYMSPEQAGLSGVDVDTRTDIYSLGVLLYELLTGSAPFDNKELLKAGVDEIRRVIREKEPARPSTRLSHMSKADLTLLAQAHHSEPPNLIRSVRGDLDWIVMKALEKDRTRRYPTANGLALDIQRFLAHEPIFARPPSKLYKLRKTAQRNKLLFASVSVIALLLIGSLIVVSATLAKERKSRRQSDEVTKFMKRMLAGAGPLVALGEDRKLLKRILDDTVPRLETELLDQPLVEAELYNLIGNLYAEMGHADIGEEMLLKAVGLNRAVLGTDSLVTAASLNVLGLQLMPQRKFHEAEKAHAEALAIRRRHLGNEHPDTATSLNDLAAAYREQSRLEEAETMAKEALQIRLKFNTNGLEVADSLRNLCIIMGSKGDWAEAEVLGRQALDMKRQLLPQLHPWLASAMEDHAWALNALSRYEEAQGLDEEALAVRQKVLGDEHPDVLRTQNALGQLLRNRGDFKSSEAILKAVLSVQLKVMGEDSQATLETYYSLADVLQREGKTAEAESLWRKTVELLRKKGLIEKKDSLIALRNLGDAYENQGKWSDGEKIWRESLPIWRKLGGIEEGESMYTLRKLALALEAQRKWPEAEAVHREALSVSCKKGDDDPEALMDLEKVVRVLTAQNKFTEAQEILDRMARPSNANLAVQKVNLMGRQGRWEEAAAAATLALEHQPTDHYRYHTLAALLAITHQRAAYEDVCKRLVANFTNSSNPFIAERIAQDCLLLPNPRENLGLIDKLADLAVTAGSNTDGVPYFHGCKAMSLYRQGRFSEAIAWGEKAAASSVNLAQAKGCAILAMARWQLGHQNEARASLLKGEALAPNISSQKDATDLGESWVAWLMARISLDEAKTLIEQNPKAYD